MAYTPVVSADLASNIVTAYVSSPLPALSPVLIMGSLINRFYEDTPGDQIGQTINIPMATGTLTPNNMGESGTTIQQTSINGTVQISLTSHQEVSWSVPDVTSSWASFDVGLAYMQKAMISLASKVESDLLNLYTGSTVNAAVGAAGVSLTPATLTQARQALVQSYVPSSEAKYLVLSPNAYASVLQNANMTQQYSVGGATSAIQTGTINERFGLNFVEHQLVHTTGTTPVATQNMVFAKDAMALVTRRLPETNLGCIQKNINFGNFNMRVTYSYLAPQLAPAWTVDILYGMTILRPEFLVSVLS